MARRGARKRKQKPSRWSSLLDRRQFVTSTLATIVGGWLFALSTRVPTLLTERPAGVPVPPQQPVVLTPDTGTLTVTGNQPGVSFHATATSSNANCDPYSYSCSTYQTLPSIFSPAS